MRLHLNALRWCSVILAMVGATSCAGAPDQPVVLQCDDGTSLSVVYSRDQSSLTVEDNGTVRLVQVRSASGVRYASDNHEYWEKNGEVRWAANNEPAKTCLLPSRPRSGNVTRIANPASVHCIDVGGQAITETRPDGSEFGVCLFEDNRQCGQWALFRGNCPIGGIRVAGFPSDAARYCAITGSAFGIAGTQETCTTPNGTVCDTVSYFDGSCR
ncbi:MAG: DUF333 domain-containing protein [Rhodospirillales bacterium]|nr:DUF333 domain-containing protein [Rhodospirillales bacterium]